MIQLLFFSVLAAANTYVCDQEIVAVEKYRKALEWLEPYQGRFQFGSCKVEFHICDPSKPKPNVGSLIGDMLIIDRSGEENYVPIHFPLNRASRFRAIVNNSRTMFNYFMSDTIQDSHSGSLEEYRLEILKKWRGEDLGQITMGTYNTKRDLIHIRDYTYRWSECFR